MKSRSTPVLLLEKEAYSKSFQKTLAENGLVARDRKSAEAIFVRVGTRVDAKLLRSFPRLKGVFTATTGEDHIDKSACLDRGVKVISLKGRTSFLRKLPNTAEHSFALLLGLYRNLPASFDSVKQGHWQQAPFRGRTLGGKRFGVVGYGRLGKIAARIARGFGMEVWAYDPYVASMPGWVKRAGSLTSLASHVDILSVYASLTPETHNLVDSGVISRMHSGSVLINVARGKIVDEKALLAALKRRSIAGAALDVLADEVAANDPKHPLIAYARTHRNLVITPHIGGQTIEAVEQADQHIFKLFRQWERNRCQSN